MGQGLDNAGSGQFDTFPHKEVQKKSGNKCEPTKPAPASEEKSGGGQKGG